MLKWLKSLFKPKSMTLKELAKSWADFHKEITDLPHVTEEKRLAKREELFQEGLKRKPALKKATTRSKTMPLVKSKSPKAVGTNYKTEIKAGKKPAQALAISLSVQDKAKKPATKKTTKKAK